MIFLTSRTEYHIQLRPGTDGAVALGMINLISIASAEF